MTGFSNSDESFDDRWTARLLVHETKLAEHQAETFEQARAFLLAWVYGGQVWADETTKEKLSDVIKQVSEAVPDSATSKSVYPYSFQILPNTLLRAREFEVDDEEEDVPFAAYPKAARERIVELLLAGNRLFRASLEQRKFGVSQELTDAGINWRRTRDMEFTAADAPAEEKPDDVTAPEPDAKGPGHRYFVSYFLASSTNSWSFSNSDITSNKPLETWEAIESVREVVEERRPGYQATILNWKRLD